MSLQLYSLTIEKPSAILKSIIGQFSGHRIQEIVIAKGSLLELLRHDVNSGQLTTVTSYNSFGIIRDIASFRIAGSSKDHIIVSSDSGRIALLDYNAETNQFDPVHLETYGKTGVRRVVPGQYLAVDPKGRAALIASVEKNKLVYVLNRDSQANITISSPLEAHTNRTLVYSVIGLDVDYENPTFAALEVDYTQENATSGDNFAKKLTYYELDLGLNHVIRKWTDTVDRKSNILIQVPGGKDGPSGVLVGTENFICYRHNGRSTHRVLIPKRSTSSDQSQPTIVITAVMHKMRGAFFFLVQNEIGDLFKVTLELDDRRNVQEMRIKYFDTIPPAVSLNILKSGFLFAACEQGNHRFYQFNKLGDDDDEPEWSSRDYESGEMYQYEPIEFQPRELDNIQMVDELRSLNPLMATLSTTSRNGESDSDEHIVTISGQGALSTLRVLEPGLNVNEIVSSELPAAPLAVWTTKINSEDEYDKYIVLSFSNETLVLSIGDTVEEVTDSGFLSSVSTIAVQQLGTDSLLQIHSLGIRHIRRATSPTNDAQINEWRVPKGTYIVAASTNNYQVALALSNNELVYFEVDEEGQLNEYEDRIEIPGTPVALSIGEVPEGRIRGSFLAIGCNDSTLRVLSLDLGSTLETLSVQALTATPSDVCIMSMRDTAQTDNKSPPLLYLHIGLSNGVYIVSILDSLTGELSDTRTRFLGPKSIQLFRTRIHNQESILALCTKSWLGFIEESTFQMAPLSYEPLDHASAFSSEECPEGIVGIQENNLRTRIREQVTALSHTPRRLVQNSFSNYFYTVEADNNTLSEQHPSNGDANPLLNGSSKPSLDPKQFGYERRQGSWASAIEIIDSSNNSVISKINLSDNYAALCACNCTFGSTSKEYLVVSGSINLVVLPKSSSGGFISVYEYTDNGRSLDLLHTTKVEDTPSALLEFQDKLLAGIGPVLRLYDLGMKQLLRKSEERLPYYSVITTLATQGNRIVVGDVQRSLTYVVYKARENRLIPFCDDAIARHITSCVMLDYDTCAAGDRFGNIFVLRCPKKISDASDEDEYGAFMLNRPSRLNGAPEKLDLLNHFYAQDIATSIFRASLVAGGRESIIYCGLQGTIGALIPLASKPDIDFFNQLESLMRTHEIFLTGRDHLVYRGYYAPVKSVVDGDLCERYGKLPAGKQELIAGELDRTVREVEKKIADMRARTVF